LSIEHWTVGILARKIPRKLASDSVGVKGVDRTADSSHSPLLPLRLGSF
jgi:hypothetical protein